MTPLVFETERLAGAGGLVADLLNGDPEALRLFPPGVLDATVAPVVPDPANECRIPKQAFVRVTTPGRERLGRVISGEGIVVSTGQQPQLFGGPLYVLYKALTAVHTASVIEKQLGRPCLAVFWVAGDDHDWNEVASIGLLDREERLRKLAVAPVEERAGRSVGPSPLPDDIDEIARQFCDSMERRDGGNPWIDSLLDSYRPGRTFTEAFVEVVSGWLAGWPIAFVDSAHPELRRAAGPFYRAVLENHESADGALAAGTSSVTDLGYRPQLTYLENAVPVFRDTDEGRCRLYGTRLTLRIGRGGESRPLGEMLADIASDPIPYSPSAALRPALESWLLPVAATVLGPGEIAYWSQLSPTFDLFGVTMPAIRPRRSWRVLEPRVSRLLEKTGVNAEDLSDGGTAAVAGLVERSRPRAVEEALLQLEDRVEEEFRLLEDTVGTDLPGLRSAVGKSRSQAFAGLAGFRRTLDSATRKREETAVAQLRRAADNLYPEGTPQERALSVYVFLARHGDSFLHSAWDATLNGNPEVPSDETGGVAGNAAAE